MKETIETFINAMKNKKAKPTITEAVELTTATINIRAARYRNTVIIVVIVAFASLITAGIQMAWKPLLGFFLIVPVAGFFLP